MSDTEIKKDICYCELIKMRSIIIISTQHENVASNYSYSTGKEEKAVQDKRKEKQTLFVESFCKTFSIRIYIFTSLDFSFSLTIVEKQCV